jgi:Obg family GTPase CgtA-like protein
VVLNKIDLVPDDERAVLVAAFRERVAANELPADATVVREPEMEAPIVLGTSCATGAGIRELVTALFRHVPIREVVPVPDEPELVDYLVYRPGRQERGAFRLMRDEDGVRIVSPALEALLGTLDLADPGDQDALAHELERRGIIRALKNAGVRDGDEIAVGEQRFTYAAEDVS